MGYVAVKGGSSAIEASIARLSYERLKHGRVLDVDQIQAGMRSLVDQVMSEGSLYDERVASMAIKQAEGSPEEAVFIMRAFRSTLPRMHYSRVMRSEEMHVERRISATFKDIPGGQILGACYDYVHRLIDPSLLNETDAWAQEWVSAWHASAAGLDANEGDRSGAQRIGRLPKVVEYLRSEGLMVDVAIDESTPKDVTKQSISFPTKRSERLQVLTRGQTGAVTALGYASLRGYGPQLHPTVGELRVGFLPVTISDPLASENEPGVEPNPDSRSDDEEDAYYIGQVKVTEVETVVPVSVPLGQGRSTIRFELGYGICFGQNETKAIAMSLLDQCLEQEGDESPTHNEEFVLLHVDSVEATGFISHLKLPHYVTFQSELDSVRHTQPETAKL